MVRVEATRDLPVSVREGFDYITDVGNWLEYWPGVVEVPDQERIRWSEPGDEATVVLELRGRPTPMHMKLSRFAPYEGVFYSSTQEGLPEFQHERHFRDHEGRLRYTLAIGFEPRGLIDRLFVRRVVRRSLEETLDNLERIFEGRT